MATELGIVNQALDLLAANTITALSDNVKQAKVMSRMLPFSREAVLRDVAPNFARRYIELTAVDPANPPTPAPLRIPDFGYVFALPTDCLRAMWVKIPDSRTGQGFPVVYHRGLEYENRFKVIGRWLGADIDPIELVYITKTTATDPQATDLYADWDPSTAEALSAHLAWKAAHPLTQSTRVRDDMKDTYMQMKEDAIATDGLEGVQDKFRTEQRLTGVRRSRMGITTR